MWSLRLRRLRYRRRVSGSPLADCWRAALPARRDDWHRVPFLAIDAEMSSLDAASGELLSLGWVAIDAGAIRLDSAEHHLLRPAQSVGQSAAIHHLRDCEFDQAEPAQKVLERLLAAAAGRVLVFHNATLDMAFLNRACRRAFRAPLLAPVVDTLLQEEALLRRRDQPIRPGDLRLQACRERYHLPHFDGHNALLDALATAELLLALASHRSRGRPLSLGQLL